MDEDVNWVSDNALILLGSVTVSSGKFSQWWQCFYEGISCANDVIVNLDKVPDIPIFRYAEALLGLAEALNEHRQRIRNEYVWELTGENHMYFDVLRWDTWHQQKFVNGNSMTEIWGSKKYTNTYIGDYSKIWPIPQAEIEWNSNLKQNSGWY